MAKKPSTTYSELKTQRLNGRHTMDNIKQDIRNQYKNRLKQLRNNHLYSIRNLTNCVDNLKLFNHLLSVQSSGLTNQEILDIMEEVENELKQYESDTISAAEQYDQDNQAILDDYLKATMCPICTTQLPIYSPESGQINQLCFECKKHFED